MIRKVFLVSVFDKLNLTMLCDFYELTMSQGYFANGYRDRITYFDVCVFLSSFVW